MKTKLTLVLFKCIALLLLLLLLDAQRSALFAQGTAFTYQGRLTESGNNASGAYDLAFSLFGASSGGSPIGAPQTNNAVAVSNGLFTVGLDFGPNFPGADRWLEIGARASGGGEFATLSPRQKLTATPYAVTARNVTGVVPSASLAGTYSSVLTLNNAGNSFSGSGVGLTGVNAVTLGGLGTNQLWRTAGNSGTTPAANFLGTTDNQPLELRANGQRAFRLQPFSGIGVSVVGGSNTVDASAPAATIAGGVGNVIRANGFYSTIGGGRNNILENSAQQVVIAGGIENRMDISANSSAIGGGWQNVVQSNTAMSVIAGGWTNSVGPFGTASAIGGGNLNSIQMRADYSTIGGGRLNRIQPTNQYAAIGGGGFNVIETGANNSVIGGGFGSIVHSNAQSSVIAGGGGHEIQSSSSSVGGGYNNVVEANAENSTIGGGTANKIGTGANSSTIAGGTLNRIEQGANFSAIGGGSSNKGDTNAVYATIAGGSNNRIQPNADHSAIGGGQLNTIAPDTGKAVIAGGDGNVAAGTSSAIGGGTLNLIDAGSTYGTIAGGGGNRVAANSLSATIAGGFANNGGAQYSTIGGGNENTNTSGGTWATIGGGLRNLTYGNYATVAGGVNNGSGLWGAVGGGDFNSASGQHSTVPGGNFNTAGGNFSFAAGRTARALHQGTFAWAGGSTMPYATTFDYSFNVYASNGVSMDYGPQSAAQPRGARYVYIGPINAGDTITTWNGAHLTDGGVWSNASDRNRKADFKPANPREVLERLAALSINEWRYTNECAGVKHLGPTAQDFQSAFGLGTDDKSIGTVDADGVALAAIQGLNEIVREQKTELREKDRKIAALEQRLDALEKLCRVLSP